MGYAIARVKIGELDRFLATFGGAGKEKRAEYGCRGVQVHQSTDDPTQLVNIFDWDRTDLEAFMADPEVEGIMESAGLRTRPDFTYVERIAEFDS
jgi:quinol monooxygenase YgiN